MRLPAPPSFGKPLSAAWGQQLVAYIASITPREGSDIGVRTTAAGTTFFIKKKSISSTTAVSDFPFKVYTREDPNNPGLFQARVSYFSSLMKSIVGDDRQTITGLSFDPADITGDDEDDWFALDSEDFIWLEITVDETLAATGATIASWGMGSGPSWSPSALPGSADGPITYELTFDDNGNGIYTQISARIGIAYSRTDIDGNPSIVQLLDSNLIMQPSFYFGPTDDDDNSAISIGYPFPFSGPYIG